ncbi:hypothetical protein [Candidatus Nitrotoga sp. 1052]|uniref:hypothetical protein n=1 Tax=Candidatus Nitrotoga sp. 1052 TaxID=2886964 RepID=UPI001EF4D658|nr:hypothetical protein [Candidatus Nitrotoga sp. 1052]CAH1085687.1 hypothetical protein NTG1052_550059 [Candidatus Nitrotoga sp. 1052]
MMERTVFKIPDYEVIIHIIVSKFSASLDIEIETISKEFNLHESTKYNGHRDYHWTFDSWGAVVAASCIR